MFTRHKYKEDITMDSIKDPVASVKYDGANFWMVFDKEGKPNFVSRRQSVKGHYPDRTSQLPQFHDIKFPEYAGHVVNVELIHTGHSKNSIEHHNLVSGILNSLAPRAIETQKSIGPVRAVMIDVISPKLDTYGEKIGYLTALQHKVGKQDLLFTPELKIGHKDINQLIDSTKNEGREGVIITSLTTPEVTNPRLKIKHYKTFNLKIKKILQEYDKNGNPKNSAGAVTVEDATGREVGNVGTGWSRDQREDIWKNPHNWLERPIQVKAYDSQAVRLRMPVYNGEPDGDIDVVPLPKK